MPPYKAISAAALDRLALDDAGMGYIIQMLLRAHALRLRVTEVEVGCRSRVAGVSKVSGTLVGTVVVRLGEDPQGHRPPRSAAGEARRRLISA